MDSNRITIWVRNAALIGVIVAFIVFFGMPAARAPVEAVAEVDGELVSREVFEFFRRQLEQRFENAPEAGGAGAVRELVDRQTLDSLLRRVVLSQEAKNVGLRVTDREVRGEIMDDPVFRDEQGRFDRERFEQFVARHDLGSERIYTEELRRDLLVRKFERLVTSPVRASERRVRELVEKSLTKLRLRYAAAREARFQVPAPTDDEVGAFVEAEQPRLSALYQRRSGEFHRPETIRARHILFTGEDGRARAESALARLRAGEPFEKLARELSDDRATRDQGGALGEFPRGRMAPEFESAAFALEPGQVSEPVESTFGYHLILLEERRPAVERTLEEVAPELGRELLTRERTQTLAREAAESVAARVRAGESLEAAAAGSNLELGESPLFEPGSADVPDFARAEGLLDAALSLAPDHPASPRVFEGADGFYLISLLERQGPDPGEVGLRVRSVRERAEDEARAELLGRWYRNRRAELQQRGRIKLYPLYPGAE